MIDNALGQSDCRIFKTIVSINISQSVNILIDLRDVKRDLEFLGQL